jgi:glucosamine--fructose-6-phosphate aminotransferase (isomerizing)
MCGIIGYIGEENAIPILVDGLKRLEYRGYDSAGVAVMIDKKDGDDSEIFLVRAAGRVANLETKLGDAKNGPQEKSHAGIAHTRWATHGAPSEKNAHPHADCNGAIFVVHNGIIENYAELKKDLIFAGHRFSSDTDTEVLAHLIEKYYHEVSNGVAGKSLFHATQRALKEVRGTYAIAVIAAGEPKTIVCARSASPLIIGIGDGENIIASDASAILGRTKKVLYLDDGEIAEVGAKEFIIETLDGTKIERATQTLTMKLEDAGKNGHPHFMHKEIFEAPDVVVNALRANGETLGTVIEKLGDFENILIVACGTAAHAGYVGKYLFEAYANIPVEVDIGSEFRYRKTPLRPKTLAIAISQSGETADTLASIREAKRLGARTLAIVNTVGSTIARETDMIIYNHAGPEISVASTKAFISQLTVLAMMTAEMARWHGNDNDKSEAKKILGAIKDLPPLIKKILAEQEPIVKTIATKYARAERMFFLGRNHNFPIALEGALKLKEVAYLHAEGCAAGEFKHGPIAMIDAQTPTFFVMPKDSAYEKTKSNLEEVKARGGPVIALTTEGAAARELRAWTSDVIAIPDCHEALTPILAAIPVYLFAYHVAVARGCDVDKPRNLAKSVTVE